MKTMHIDVKMNTYYSEAIAAEIKAELDLATQPWGVVVERVEVKDVSVPEQLQRSLASAAEAEREARAKVCALIRNQKISETRNKVASGWRR